MELVIQIRDGVPFEHPILLENFKQAFPDIDVNNLPSEFARFVRIPPPEIGHYQINEGSKYEFLGGIWTDVWQIRDMTPEEKASKIALAQPLKPFPSWVFDEANYAWVAPVAYPDPSKLYDWDEGTLSWILRA